jgi:hypothetical protein
MGMLLPWPEPDSDPTHPQPILRTVDDGVFVHFYLACGHLITVAKNNVGERLPRNLECWACAVDNNGNSDASHEPPER